MNNKRKNRIRKNPVFIDLEEENKLLKKMLGEYNERNNAMLELHEEAELSEEFLQGYIFPMREVIERVFLN